MRSGIDNPLENDNRAYDYSRHTESDRPEYGIIARMIQPGASVLDLACGDGSLMLRLQTTRNARVQGMERSPTAIASCRSKGLEVSRGDIDAPLPYADNAFDYAVCNVTIQMVMYPEVLLREMKRVAVRQIVSFPNFAFYRNRLELLIRGRMPTYGLFGYQWYSTGHIHQLSIRDFRSLVRDVGGLRILETDFVGSMHPLKGLLGRWFPNVFQLLPVFLLERSHE